MRVGKTLSEIEKKFGAEEVQKLIESGEYIQVSPKNRKQRRGLEARLRSVAKQQSKVKRRQA